MFSADAHVAVCQSLEQAEILTASIKGILCDTLARLSAQYATHTEAEKVFDRSLV